jgi:hypothetical protein
VVKEVKKNVLKISVVFGVLEKNAHFVVQKQIENFVLLKKNRFFIEKKNINLSNLNYLNSVSI